MRKLDFSYLEKWKPIPGFPNYSVSNMGRIRNQHGKVMRPRLSYAGKKPVRLTIILKDASGKPRYVFIHKEVARAFVANPHNYPFVTFKNKNFRDCKAQNLRWVSREISNKELLPRGKNRKNTKNSELDILEAIHLLNTTKLSCKQIARKLKLKNGIVESIYYGYSWKHLYEKPKQKREVARKKHSGFKISYETAEEIRTRYKNGESLSQLAKAYNISPSLVSRIKNNKRKVKEIKWLEDGTGQEVPNQNNLS